MRRRVWRRTRDENACRKLTKPESGPGVGSRHSNYRPPTPDSIGDWASLLRVGLRGGRHGGAVGHEHEQGGRRAERPARDAVVARPTAVGVLDAAEILGHRLVPVLPFLAALGQQRLADLHVAEEL